MFARVGSMDISVEGSTWYVADLGGHVIGACTDFEAALELARFFEPQAALAQEFAAIDQAPAERPL